MTTDELLGIRTVEVNRTNYHYCDMFSGRTCRLTGEIVLFPDKYTGHEYPLEFIEEGDNDE